jgi:hypothetical protein
MADAEGRLASPGTRSAGPVPAVPATPAPATRPAEAVPATPAPATPSPATPSPAEPSPAEPSPATPSPATPSPAEPSPGGPASPAARRGQLPVRWLSIFGVSFGLLLVRFLVPVPVGQADNRDGPRLMCGRGLHLGPVVPSGDPRFFRFAYFAYAPSPSCNKLPTYPSSELLPLEVARLLTPVLRLPGTLNLIALGLLMCLLTAVGIASLATGLRLPLWAQLLVAAAVWLIMADAAFFDTDASPFSEPAALVGLLLVAAGIVYLGRGWRETLAGLALAGPGGFLAILSKEQYLILAAPICLALVLAAADRSSGLDGRLGRFRTRQASAALAVALILAVLSGGYLLWDRTSPYAARLHHVQAVDMIFDDIVDGHDNARADLRALGLPASWARYAGDYYWDTTSVRNDPLYQRYEDRLTDGNITHFLLTHPGRIISIGQQAAVFAQQFRVTTLGDYPPSAGHPPGTPESRVTVVTWLMGRLPAGLGLAWYLPLWAAMTALAAAALARRRRPWHRGAAALVLCMTGCAVVAFIPPAYFAGISTTRHMVGMNLATALAFVVSVTLAASIWGKPGSPGAAPGS